MPDDHLQRLRSGLNCLLRKDEDVKPVLVSTQASVKNSGHENQGLNEYKRFCKELSMERDDYRYIDGKAFKYILESVKLNNVYVHIVFTIGLNSVKSEKSDLTMPRLLEGAKDAYVVDEFIQWVERFTPYKYSNKKKRLVRNDKAAWRLDQAFDNPEITSRENLDEATICFKKSKNIRSNEQACIEDFQLYVEERLQAIDRLVEERISRNKTKLSNQYLVNEPVFDDFKDEERRLIKEYLARNPAPDTVGPMGTPQSRYRHGTFGLASMEYDAWSRS